MSDTTNIEWCDSTFNPWRGCTPVSNGPCGGCNNCYAAALSRRTGGPAYESGAPRVRTTDANWRIPVGWNRKPFLQCTACGWRGDRPGSDGDIAVCPIVPCSGTVHLARRRVFCSSLADVFDNEVPWEWRADLFHLISETPNIDWLVLTKRIGNMTSMVPAWWQDPEAWPGSGGVAHHNVWLGATVVTQEEAERDIPKLLATAAAKHFVSIEPMLGPIDLRNLLLRDDEDEVQTLDALTGHGGITLASGSGRSTQDVPLDWVIAGGESGGGARPARPEWFRALRDQCAAAGVPFMFKQWGAWAPAASFPYEMQRWGKKLTGRSLDGRVYDAFPEVRHA